MSGGAVVAPGAPVPSSGARQALHILGDLLLATLLIWALPLGAAILFFLIRVIAAQLTG